MLFCGVCREIPLKIIEFVFPGGLGPKAAPGPMKNHRKYCRFSMPATRDPFWRKPQKFMEFLRNP